MESWRRLRRLEASEAALLRTWVKQMWFGNAVGNVFPELSLQEELLYLNNALSNLLMVAVPDQVTEIQ